MSELKAHRIVGMDERCARVDNDYYLKSEADKVIADLEESHKKEVEQLLMEIVDKDKVIAYARALVREDLKIIRHHKYKRSIWNEHFTYEGLRRVHEAGIMACCPICRDSRGIIVMLFYR